MNPPKSILDPSFRYTDSAATDVAATFRRIRRELAAAVKAAEELARQEAERKVTKIRKMP